MTALAAYLHHFYTGVESALVRLAEQLDGNVPQSSRWHVELLNLMAAPLTNVRPAILRKVTAALLDDYRGFRHVFRHGYKRHLDWRRLRILAEDLPKAYTNVADDLRAAVQFLNCLSEPASPGAQQPRT